MLRGRAARLPMHTYDENLADMVFAYMRERLQLDPVPLDHPGVKDKLDRTLDGLLGADGNDPADVLALYADHLAPAVILVRQPAVPVVHYRRRRRKAALLFDHGRLVRVAARHIVAEGRGRGGRGEPGAAADRGPGGAARRAPGAAS
ncbi:hypothetical protein ACU686_32645 [Yinghuangia aomiensis]